MGISCSVWIQHVNSFPVPVFFYLSTFTSGPSICLPPDLFLPLLLTSSESALLLVPMAALTGNMCVFPGKFGCALTACIWGF